MAAAALGQPCFNPATSYAPGSEWCYEIAADVCTTYYQEYNALFRMCIVTRNPDLELPPDAAALVSEINFSVTRSGLEGQLLGVTIQHEQPELEMKKQEMLQSEEAYKVQLAEVGR